MRDDADCRLGQVVILGGCGMALCVTRCNALLAFSAVTSQGFNRSFFFFPHTAPIVFSVAFWTATERMMVGGANVSRQWHPVLAICQLTIIIFRTGSSIIVRRISICRRRGAEGA